MISKESDCMICDFGLSRTIELDNSIEKNLTHPLKKTNMSAKNDLKYIKSEMGSILIKS